LGGPAGGLAWEGLGPRRVTCSERQVSDVKGPWAGRPVATPGGVLPPRRITWSERQVRGVNGPRARGPSLGGGPSGNALSRKVLKCRVLPRR